MKQKSHLRLQPRMSSIFQRHMFCSLRLPGNRRVLIAERPGLWMSDADLEAWARPCREIAQESLQGKELDYGVFKGSGPFWSEAIITLIEDRDTGQTLAFNVMRLLPVQLGGREEEVLHLGLTMVSPQARGQALTSSLYILTCVLYYFRRQCRPFWISSVSQVPAAVGLVGETFVDVFPGLDRSALPPARHLGLATQIMANHRSAFGVSADAAFREDRFVIEDAYRGGSDHLKKAFGDAPAHRLDAYNRLCSEELDYARGDDFLQIGRANAEAARRILRRRLEGLAGTGFSLQLASLFLSSLVAPLAQWLNPARTQGDLRARGRRKDQGASGGAA